MDGGADIGDGAGAGASYRLQSFLMFSARTWGRLFERMNEAWWPAPPLVAALAAALAIAVAIARHRARGDGRTLGVGAVEAAAAAGLALAWLGTGVLFHAQRHATIHWVAPGWAAASLLQAAMLAWQARRLGRSRGPGAASPVDADGAARRHPSARAAGALAAVVVAAGLVGDPLLGAWAGRAPMQAQWPGFGPDATALLTLGWLAGRRGRASLWPIPLASAAWGALTAHALGRPDAWVVALAASLAPAAAALRAVAHARRDPPPT